MNICIEHSATYKKLLLVYNEFLLFWSYLSHRQHDIYNGIFINNVYSNSYFTHTHTISIIMHNICNFMQPYDTDIFLFIVLQSCFTKYQH